MYEIAGWRLSLTAVAALGLGVFGYFAEGQAQSRAAIDLAGLKAAINGGRVIKDRTIRGVDLVEALIGLAPRTPVKVETSDILGPLDLSVLPGEALQDLSLGDGLRRRIDAAVRATTIYRARPIVRTPRISACLDISNSRIIASTPQNLTAQTSAFQGRDALLSEPALLADGVLFECRFALVDVEIIGVANFTNAIFAAGADFKGSKFDGVETVFARALFLSVDDPKSRRRSGANFRRTQFAGAVNFDRVYLENNPNFAKAKFEGGATFNINHFKGRTNFDGADFLSELTFRSTVFRGDVSFSNVTVSQEFIVEEVTFQKSITIDGSTFSGIVEFNVPRFGGDLNIRRSNFGSLSFDTSTSTGIAPGSSWAKGRFSLADSKFENLTLGGLEFSRDVDLSNLQIDGKLFFRRPKFKAPLSITDSRISKSLSARRIEFRKRFTMSGNRVGTLTDFTQSTFKGAAHFGDTQFLGPVSFRAVRFFGKFGVKFAEFGDYVDFRQTAIPLLDLDRSESPGEFGGRLDFKNARICAVVLRSLIFREPVDFSQATLGPNSPAGRPRSAAETEKSSAEMDAWQCPSTKARTGPGGKKPEPPLQDIDFHYATFEDDALFRGTSFRGSVRLHNVDFGGLADFDRATFAIGPKPGKDAFILSDVRFGDLRLDWSQLPPVAAWQRAPDLQPLAQVLRDLESRFRSKKQLESANSAYYHLKRAELAALRERGAGWGKISLDDPIFRERLVAEAVWWTWGLTTGYGTRIFWILGWAVLVNLLFTAIYACAGGLERKAHPPISGEFTFKQRLFDFPKAYFGGGGGLFKVPEWVRGFINALRFSSVILFKFGYRDTTISGRFLWVNLRYIVMAEWLIGFYIMAAIIFTLAETMPLVNRLLGGLF